MHGASSARSEGMDDPLAAAHDWVVTLGVSLRQDTAGRKVDKGPLPEGADENAEVMPCCRAIIQ